MSIQSDILRQQSNFSHSVQDTVLGGAHLPAHNMLQKIPW